MKRKGMEFAVFWLVIVGPILIGLAGCIWYGGGGRTPALWVGFSGTVLLMLAAALQSQQAIWKSQASEPIATTTSKPEALPQSTPPPELTIENLWRDDFAIGSYRLLQGFGIDLFKEGGEKLGTFDIGVGMYGDFTAKSLFMSLYVPGSDHGYEVIGWFAEGYKDYLHDARTNIHLWTAPEGDQSQPLSDDLLFTNRIYIYYENIFSDAQILALTNLYKSKGLEPVFRGLGYLEHQRLIHRTLSPPRVPMSASPNFKMPPFTPAPKNDAATGGR
jgi:hypothetical protein